MPRPARTSPTFPIAAAVCHSGPPVGSISGATTSFNRAAAGRRGRVRVLGVAWSKRSPQVPDVPTMIEQGVNDFTAASYVGILAPAATPAEIVKTLEGGSIKAMNEGPAEKILNSGAELVPDDLMTSQGFGDYIKKEFDLTREAAKIAGLTLTWKPGRAFNRKTEPFGRGKPRFSRSVLPSYRGGKFRAAQLGHHLRDEIVEPLGQVGKHDVEPSEASVSATPASRRQWSRSADHREPREPPKRCASCRTVRFSRSPADRALSSALALVALRNVGQRTVGIECRGVVTERDRERRDGIRLIDEAVEPLLFSRASTRFLRPPRTGGQDLQMLALAAQLFHAAFHVGVEGRPPASRPRGEHGFRRLGGERCRPPMPRLDDDRPALNGTAMSRGRAPTGSCPCDRARASCGSRKMPLSTSRMKASSADVSQRPVTTS